MESTPEIEARVERVLDHLRAGLVERDEATRLVLLAALAGEHVLLVGPPGTAKSQLARRLQSCLHEGRYFERLLTRFSVPEELFGPLSIESLQRDEYRRLTEGYLPDATVAFLDEVFKANSAILNALLTLLNEREFDNGRARVPVPLVSVIGASNELPEGEELAALYDRFLFRVLVEAVSDAAFDDLLAAPVELPTLDADARFSAEDLEAIRDAARGVAVPSSVRTVLRLLRRGLQERGYYVSDRRWKQLARVMRVAACCEGRSAANVSDVWLCEHALWSEPGERDEVVEAIREALDDVLVEEPKRFVALGSAFRTQLEKETGDDCSLRDEEGRLLYLDESGEHTPDPRGPGTRFRAPHDFRGTERASHSGAELWEEHYRYLPDGLARMNRWLDDPSHVVAHGKRALAKGRRTYSCAHVEKRREQVALLARDVRRFRAGLESIREQRSLFLGDRAEEHAEHAKRGLDTLDELDLDALEELVDELGTSP